MKNPMLLCLVVTFLLNGIAVGAAPSKLRMLDEERDEELLLRFRQNVLRTLKDKSFACDESKKGVAQMSFPSVSTTARVTRFGTSIELSFAGHQETLNLSNEPTYQLEEPSDTLTLTFLEERGGENSRIAISFSADGLRFKGVEGSMIGADAAHVQYRSIVYRCIVVDPSL